MCLLYIVFWESATFESQKVSQKYFIAPGGCFNGEVEVKAKVESREKAQILEILLSEQGGNSKNIELTKTEYFLNILKILLIKPKYFPAQVGEADLA